MSFEINILDRCIRFFSKLQTSCENMVHELKFMKYNHIFGERDDDIYIATFAKSGTTWMQMILYQLTTAGDIDFEHIYDVSPWLRNLAETNGVIPELKSPRIVKTHDYYDRIPGARKCRYIYIIRDGRDVALSFYHHRKNYNLPDLTFEASFDLSFREPGKENWFEFNRQWLENSKGLNILYVRYEDLKTNFAVELYRIADFIGVGVKEDDLPRIVERTSFQFMKKHETKFGEQPEKKKHERVYDQFIRSGNVGEGAENMSDEQLKFFDDQFNRQLSGFAVMRPYSANHSASAPR